MQVSGHHPDVALRDFALPTLSKVADELRGGAAAAAGAQPLHDVSPTLESKACYQVRCGARTHSRPADTHKRIAPSSTPTRTRDLEMPLAGTQARSRASVREDVFAWQGAEACAAAPSRWPQINLLQASLWHMPQQQALSALPQVLQVIDLCFTVRLVTPPLG